MTHPTSIRLPDELDTRLGQLSQLSGKSKSIIIRQLVEDHIDDLEDIYYSIRSLEKGGKTWSLSELEGKYGTGDDTKMGAPSHGRSGKKTQ